MLIVHTGAVPAAHLFAQRRDQQIGLTSDSSSVLTSTGFS